MRNITIAGVIIAGFILRLFTARGTWLNPDEAIIYLIANQPNLIAVYQAGLTNPHPPLLYILIHLWRLLGTSELFLRLFSVLSGTAAIWFFFRFLATRLDSAAALSGAILFAFLPPAVALSAELRQYAPALLFFALALYCTEAGIKKTRPGFIILACLFSILSGFTLYSTLWLAIAFGIYLLLQTGKKKNLLIAALVGLAAVMGSYLFHYITHIRRIQHSPMQEFAVTGWLARSYYQPGAEHPGQFIIRATFDLFKYIFGTPVTGIIGIILVIVGIIFTIRENKHRSLLILIIIPFVLGISGALLRLLPYGGTRHTFFLLPSIVIAVSTIVRAIPKKLSFVAPALAGLLVLLGNLFLIPPRQFIPRPDARQELMHRAITTLKTNTVAGDTIFTDYQSALLLSYYLANPKRPVPFFGKPHGPFWEFNYGDYLIVSSQEWDFNRNNFPLLTESLVHYYHFAPGRIVWIFDGGWGRPPVLDESLWGRNLSVFPIKLLPPLSPHQIESLLIAAGEKIKELKPAGVRSVILPVPALSPALKTLFQSIAPEVTTYPALYKSVEEKGTEYFSSLLPCLAFWRFGDPSPHPQFIRYMNDGEHYLAAGYRFTLLLTDVNRQVAVYRIEQDKK